MLRIEDTKQKWVNAAVYGLSGSGKTSMGTTAPGALILLSEAQGALHIKQAATRLGIERPEVLLMQCVDDYRNVMRALYGDRSKPFEVRAKDGDQSRVIFSMEKWPDSVVIDSLTDAARLMVEEINQIAPPRPAADGLPEKTMRHWDALGDRMRAMIVGFRDAPVNTLYLCQCDDRVVGKGDDAKRIMAPDLPMRKLVSDLTAAVNVIGYTYRRIKQVPGPNGTVLHQVHYGVITIGPEYMVLKPCHPLRPSESPDFARWVEAITTGAMVKSEAPPPSDELGDVEPPAPTAETKQSKRNTKKEAASA
jgi:hypothetical protein